MNEWGQKMSFQALRRLAGAIWFLARPAPLCAPDGTIFWDRVDGSARIDKNLCAMTSQAGMAPAADRPYLTLGDGKISSQGSSGVAVSSAHRSACLDARSWSGPLSWPAAPARRPAPRRSARGLYSRPSIAHSALGDAGCYDENACSPSCASNLVSDGLDERGWS